MRLSLFMLAALVVLAACDSASVESGLQPTAEPRPPDVLDLTVISGPDDAGLAVLEAVITSAVDGDAELSLIGPPGLVFDSGEARMALSLSRGAPVQRLRVPLDLSGGAPVTVTARLTLFNDSGEPSMIIDRSLEFNEPPSDPAAELVSLVVTLDDGTRIVQRLPRAEAERLAAEGRGEIGGESPPSPSPEEGMRDEGVRDEGGDLVPGPEVQQ